MRENKMIIPAAGFGTRVGMAPNQSKELLFGLDGRPMIEFSLRLAETSGLVPVVITREEKLDLLGYLHKRGGVEVHVIEPQGEWPDTILSSAHLWGDINILCLPDTVFSPAAKVVKCMILGHQHWGHDVSAACHAVNDPSNWGIVSGRTITEKPQIKGPSHAWGLLGWKEAAGRDLFLNLRERGRTYFVPGKFTGNYKLDSFTDLTR